MIQINILECILIGIDFILSFQKLLYSYIYFFSHEIFTKNYP